MAESQESFDYDAAILDALEAGLSATRLRDYLSDCHGDSEQAVRLYLWNARLSKAFLFPLQICEVLTRNAIDRAFSARWGREWVFAPPFVLNQFSNASHQRTLERVRRNAERSNSPPPTADDVIAALTFDFWSNLFRQDYHAALWSDDALIAAAFPNLPVGEGRSEIQTLMASVNTLRNRIAHHEPIYNRQDHAAKLHEILTLIGHICRPTREWTRQHSTVTTVAKSPPNAHSKIPGRPLAQANLRRPHFFEAGTKLSEVVPVVAAARPPVVLVTGYGENGAFAAVTAQTVFAHAASQMAMAGGLVDFNDHTLADVLEGGSPTVGIIDHRSTTGDAMARFYPGKGKDRVDLLIVESDGMALGVLQRPDTRF